MESGNKFLTDNEPVGWTNQQLLNFYQRFNMISFLTAAKHDQEMMCYVNALGYYYRAKYSKGIYFEPVGKDYQDNIIKTQFQNFLDGFESKVKSQLDESIQGDPRSIFKYVLKDSEMGMFGKITKMDNAVYAMRDEVICEMICQLLVNFGPNIFNIGEYRSDLMNLIKYNPDIHRGVKYNCYKNQFISDRFGLMVFGVSMLLQHEIENDKLDGFDSFCDHFEVFFQKVMNNCSIDMEGSVDKDSYSSDMKSILDHLCQRNVWFFEQNYEVV